METQRKMIRVAFSSQKGGVGKSTFTVLAASILHYRLGYNVVVVDCDFPQHSLMQFRERDLKAVMENENYKKMAHRQFSEINKKAYPVLQSSPEAALEQVERYLAGAVSMPDIIFFDLPGTVNTPGVLTTLAAMHYIFAPLSADRMVLESTLSFLHVLSAVLMAGGHTQIEAIRLFWNQVDKREKSMLYAIYGATVAALGLEVMRTYIADSKRFRKEGEAEGKSIFRSTLLPADKKLMEGCRLDLFMDEFLRILNL